MQRDSCKTGDITNLTQWKDSRLVDLSEQLRSDDSVQSQLEDLEVQEESLQT